MIQLLEIPLPPTANHRLMPMCMGGRGRLIKSPKFRKWEKDMSLMAADNRFKCAAYKGFPVIIPFDGDELFVGIDIRWPDKRKRDLDGPVKPLLDLLVRENFIEDDSHIAAINVNRRLAGTFEGSLIPGTCDITISTLKYHLEPF